LGILNFFEKDYKTKNFLSKIKGSYKQSFEFQESIVLINLIK